MHRSTKIATCCYCGTRAALVLGEDRHELVCSACGAPLHELKAMPVDSGGRASRAKRRGVPARKGRPAPAHRWSDVERARKPEPPKRPKRRKRKRGRMLKKVAEEIFDVFDDIFD